MRCLWCDVSHQRAIPNARWTLSTNKREHVWTATTNEVIALSRDERITVRNSHTNQ